MLHNILLMDWSNDECDRCRMRCAECAVCALDGARVEAYANSYHGDSWAKKGPGHFAATLWAETLGDKVRGAMATQKCYKTDL